jgi:hypothetical protein
MAVTLLSFLPLLATHQPVVVLAIVLRHMPLLTEAMSFLPVVRVGEI